MSISYDPDQPPRPSDDLLATAAKAGVYVVNVICDEPGAVVGDHRGVSFAAMATFIPRKGDRIAPEDGRTCEVERVYFKVARVQGHASLFPNVLATLIEEPPPGTPLP